MHYYKIRRKKAIKEIEGNEENYKLYIIKNDSYLVDNEK